MLVLSRKLGEVLMIGDDIAIKVIEIDRGKIRLGITAPENIDIHREEVYLAIKEQEGRRRETWRATGLSGP